MSLTEKRCRDGVICAVFVCPVSTPSFCSFCHCHPYIPVHFWKIFYLLVYIWVLSMLLSDLLQLTTSHTQIIKLIIVISTVCGKFPSLFIQSAFKSGINPKLISIFCHKQGITKGRQQQEPYIWREDYMHDPSIVVYSGILT